MGALVGGLMGAVLVACSPPIDTRGNLPDPELLAQIEPGVHTKGDVADLLGTPSSVATFDDKAWYYIGKQTEKLAFFEPEVLEQQVVAIEFDDQGVVADVRQYGLDDGQALEMIERTTPTRGKELTFFQQLIGNFGYPYTRDPFSR